MNTGSKSDDDLLRQAKNGEETAFVQLYRRYQGPLFRFALHVSGKREVAEELIQEVFLGLLSKECKYSASRGTLEAYLIGTVRNMMRAQRRERVRFEGRGLQTEATADAGLFERLKEERDLQDLRAAILSLPLNYREVVVLCDLENMDYAQAAIRLECPVGTVRSRLHRARAILKAKLVKAEKCAI